MKSPIRKSTIEAVRQHIADARDPIAAGVAVASVSAGFGLGLLAMALQVTSRRKKFSGDHARLRALLIAAKKESGRLMRFADQDIATYQKYRESLRRKRGVDAARRRIIETPLEAASSAAQGLDLCAEAMSLVPQSVVSDVGAAAEVLAGAVRAILLTVDVNLREVPAGSKLRREWDKKRKELGRRVSQR